MLERKLPIFNDCDLTLIGVRTTLLGDDTMGCRSGYPESFTIERSYFQTDPGDVMGVVSLGPGCISRVTNSVFDNVRIHAQTNGGVLSAMLAFNTIVAKGPPVGWAIRCIPGTGMIQAVIENNIVLANTNAIEDTGTSCINGSRYNIVLPQTQQLPSSNRVVDPGLLNLTNHDFHLKPDSPAIDSAVPSSGLESAADFDGTPRPQGPKPDVGAYELTPQIKGN